MNVCIYAHTRVHCSRLNENNKKEKKTQILLESGKFYKFEIAGEYLQR